MSIATIDNIGGGTKLEDINPNQLTNSIYACIVVPTMSSGQWWDRMYTPVKNYKKVSLYNSNESAYVAYANFYDESGNAIGSTINTTKNAWTSYIDIPDNAVSIGIVVGKSGRYSGIMYISLLA